MLMAILCQGAYVELWKLISSYFILLSVNLAKFFILEKKKVYGGFVHF